MFITCEADARDYLTRHGDLVTFSRFGSRTSECVEPAYLLALFYALEDGRTTIDASDLDYAMGAVVNEADYVAEHLIVGAQRYGFNIDNIDGLEDE